MIDGEFVEVVSGFEVGEMILCNLRVVVEEVKEVVVVFEEDVIFKFGE